MLTYLWWIVAGVLFIGEMIAPGFFLIWIGLGAAAMGGLMLVFPNLGFLAQALLFSVFSFASCYFYAKWVRPLLEKSSPGDEYLNHRGTRMIGQKYLLSEAIVNGRGKAHVGDGQWLVKGPDLPMGTTVQVTSVDGTTLSVIPIGT